MAGLWNLPRGRPKMISRLFSHGRDCVHMNTSIFQITYACVMPSASWRIMVGSLESFMVSENINSFGGGALASGSGGGAVLNAKASTWMASLAR